MQRKNGPGKIARAAVTLNLDIDIIVQILLHCSPKLIILVMSRVNWNFYQASRSNLLWDFKFNLHFPIIRSNQKKIDNSPITFSKFATFYKTLSNWVDQYYGDEKSKELDKNNHSNLFYMVAKDNVQQIEHLELSDFLNVRNQYFNLLEAAIEMKSQKILDHIWVLAKKQFTNTEDTLDVHQIDFLGNGIIHWATMTNRPADEFNALILAGCNINQARSLDGMTPLLITAKLGLPEVAKTLVCIEEPRVNLVNTSNSGLTPLMLASKNGLLPIVEILISAGANTAESTGYGESPLTLALENNRIATAIVLIKNKANINQADSNGITPLWQAVKRNALEVVKLLLEKGADINHSLKNRKTPLWLSIEEGYFEIANLLIDRGGIIHPINFSQTFFPFNSFKNPIVQLTTSNTLTKEIILQAPTSTIPIKTQIINVSMIIALEKIYQFLNQTEQNPSRSIAIRALINFIYAQINKPFPNHVAHWKSVDHSKYLTLLNTPQPSTVRQISLFSKSKPTEFQNHKTELEFLIDDLVIHTKRWSGQLNTQENTSTRTSVGEFTIVNSCYASKKS